MAGYALRQHTIPEADPGTQKIIFNFGTDFFKKSHTISGIENRRRLSLKNILRISLTFFKNPAYYLREKVTAADIKKYFLKNRGRFFKNQHTICGTL